MKADVLRSRLEAAYHAYREALRSRDPRAFFAAVALPKADAEKVRADFQDLAEWMLETMADLGDATFVHAAESGGCLAGYYFLWSYPQIPDSQFLFLKTFVRVKGRWKLAMTLAADPTMHVPVEPGEDVVEKAWELIATQPFLHLRWPEWLEPVGEVREAVVVPAGEGAPAERLVVSDGVEAVGEVSGAAVASGPPAPERAVEGRTPLHAAAAAWRLEEVESLLAGGAECDAEDKERVTPLHLAAERGHRAVVERLLACEPRLRTRDTARGYSPLHCAVASGDEAIVALLLEHGADPDGNVIAGDTPLHLAARRGRLDLARRLVEGGASIYSLDRDGNRPVEAVPDAPADEAGRERVAALEQLLARGRSR